ncbi:MAG: DNA polymerase Y family protein [Dehalococcoidia bacterium]
MLPSTSLRTGPSTSLRTGPSTSLRTGIGCVHVPRFAVEVERRRRPELASRLILIGETSVFDCSLGAQASGVRPGMRVSEALGLCGKAVLFPPDLPRYRRRFEDVLDFLNGHSPQVEGAALGTAYLSLEGLPEEPCRLGERVVEALYKQFGLRGSFGAAGGKFTARVLAETARAGLVKLVPPGEEAAFLAPLPVDHLPASDSMLWRLRMLGLETMGDVAALPEGAFQQQFGPEGRRCRRLAQGIDDEPLLPRAQEETVVRRLQLPAPAVTLDAVLAGVERLVHAAYGDPLRGGRWVRKAVVRAALYGGGAWELPVPFREALADPGDAWFAVRCAVERRPPERPLEELEVELVGLSGESGRQASMFDGRAKLKAQVTEAVRQLQAQHGEVALGRAVEVEPWSRIPERRMALVDYGP